MLAMKLQIDGNFRSQKAKSGTISCLMWNIYLYFIILKLITNFQNIIVLVKIVANASLSECKFRHPNSNQYSRKLVKLKLYIFLMYSREFLLGYFLITWTVKVKNKHISVGLYDMYSYRTVGLTECWIIATPPLIQTSVVVSHVVYPNAFLID